MSETFSQRHTILIVLIVAVASFMQMLDASVLVTAIPQMARSFSVSPLALGVGITAYVMATAILLPASGWIADRIGTKRLFIIALVSFTAASILCGLSQTLPQFVVARVLQGFAGACLGPVGGLILMKIIHKRDLIRMMNIFSAPMLIAPVLGPPIGGLITTYLSWQWIFYLNLPIGVIGTLLALRFIPEQPLLRRPFDLLGFVLNGLALGSLIFGFDKLSGASFPKSVAVAFLVLGIVFGFFAIRRARRARHPLISLEPIRYPSYRLTSIFAMPFMRLPVAALPFALPIMLQVGFGMTAFVSGMLFLGHTLGDLTMKLLTTRVFRKFGYRRVMLFNVVTFATSLAACAMITRQTPLITIALLLFASGCFRSFLMSGIGTLSYAEIPQDCMTSATTFNQIVLQLTQAIGTSLTVIFIDVAMHARGSTVLDASDCRVALAIVAAISLFALLPLYRLAADAGAELSGHKGRNNTEIPAA